MNLSQIFGLFPDPDGAVQAKLDAAVGRALPLEATDHLGVVSKLWPITDQHVVSAVTGMVGPKPIFIADGHHRYETALRYQEEKQQSGEVKSPDAAANFVLMMLVSMQDPGLLILPTHRLVTGIGAMKADDVKSLLGDHFQVDVVGQGAAAAKEAWEMIEADGTQQLLGFDTVADGVWQIARFQNPAIMAQLAAEHSDSWRGLAVAVLHRLVLDKLVAPKQGQPACTYVHSLREVTSAIADKKCQLAVLVPPATMDHVEQIAGNLEKMPPKSTYFYPKLLSGLVFHSLTGN
jgi:uncharacterized protein (DUF1015 family)